MTTDEIIERLEAFRKEPLSIHEKALIIDSWTQGYKEGHQAATTTAIEEIKKNYTPKK